MSLSHKKCKQDQNRTEIDQSTERKSRSNSKKIMDKKLNEIFRIIFNLIDEKHIGLISCENLNTTEIPENILGFYQTLFSELEEFSESINLEEFLLISQNIFLVVFFFDFSNHILYF